MSARFKAMIMAAIAATLAACAPVPVASTDLPFDTPQRFSASGEALAPTRWWLAFDDPGLNILIERTLANNLDLLAAWDRLDQAGAVMRKAASGAVPSVSANLTTAGTHLSTSAAAAPPFASDGWSSTLSIAASYEVDLWGRVRNARASASAAFNASAEDVQATAIALSAEVAGAWYELRTRKAELELVRSQLQANRDMLELIELRFGQGLATAVDVLQQRGMVASSEGEVPALRMRIGITEHMLAIMLGVPPGEASLPSTRSASGRALPQAPPLPATGLPSELLLRRPDVRAALLRLGAANANTAAAVAARFPSVSITANVSGTGSNVSGIFNNWVAGLAGNLLAPIFNAGALKAEVRRSAAIAREGSRAFAKLCLRALGEVEDALLRIRRQDEVSANLALQVEIARETLIRTRERYMNGASNYLPVLNSLVALQRIERRKLESTRALISYRIDLYRALAGGWPQSLPAAARVSGEQHD